MPKISVVLPIYNVEKYLRRCLNSLLNQTFTDFEAICVNDGSLDKSLHILEEYASKDFRIKIVTQENQGLSMARNNGLKIAQGDYIYFLDSDDAIHPQLLEITYNFELITLEELKYIDKTWDDEGDLSRRTLVDLYYEIKGKHLPWDDYKVPVFSSEVIDEIKAQCDDSGIEFELISKLIVEIEANKNYTKGSRVTKAFDRIMNQGWLHYDAIKKGLKNEDK